MLAAVEVVNGDHGTAGRDFRHGRQRCHEVEGDQAVVLTDLGDGFGKQLFSGAVGIEERGGGGRS